MSEVQRIIAEIQELTNLKEVALAKKLGVSQSTFNRWKNGLHKRRWDRVKRLQRQVSGSQWCQPMTSWRGR
jgi:transposase